MDNTKRNLSTFQSILRSIWLARFFWPSLICVLLLIPACWYGMPHLLNNGFMRLLGIIGVPLVGFVLGMLARGFAMGLVSQQLNGELSSDEEEKLSAALLAISGMLQGDLSIEVAPQDRLPLLYLDAAMDSLLVSPGSLRELSADHSGMLLYAQAAGEQAQAPWLQSKLLSLACLIALVPPYTVHFTAIPESQQAMLILSSALLMLAAMLLASLNLARWREGEGDRLAAHNFGREIYNEAVQAWADHLRSHGGGNSGYKRLARLSQLR